ncbi:MAG: NUDIX domain-containing protein [Deltaproteobacteria bacterium]|nr:NUDIX domain-containing protein [Deltaproteobacteria bacterium]
MSGRLAGILPVYARLAWWGLVSPRRRARAPLVVVHGVILSERGVLLSVRSDLRGWELPGGNAEPGEPGEAALRREILEETGLEVAVERRVGDYVRTGFAPHTARAYRCRPVGGELRPSSETPLVRWFPSDAVPDTLFPWYRAPLADALAELPEPVTRHEHWGAAAIWAGMRIDLRMRLSKHRAG